MPALVHERPGLALCAPSLAAVLSPLPSHADRRAEGRGQRCSVGGWGSAGAGKAPGEPLSSGLEHVRGHEPFPPIGLYSGRPGTPPALFWGRSHWEVSSPHPHPQDSLSSTCHVTRPVSRITGCSWDLEATRLTGSHPTVSIS